MVLESYVCGGPLDTDLSNGADLADLGLWQSNELGNLLHYPYVFLCQLAGLTLRVCKLQVPNPQDG